MGTFLDSFMPAITSELGKLPAAGIQGHVQGMTTARDLALMDAQIKSQQAHVNLFQQQAQMYGTPKQTMDMQALALLQQGMASDPNFLMSPMGQVLGSRVGHAAYGDRGRTIVASPGSEVRVPGQQPQLVPNKPMVVPEGASALLPGSSTLMQAPQKSKTVSAGGAIIDPNQPAGEGLLYQAPSKAQGPGGRQKTVTDLAKEKLVQQGPDALSDGEKALLRLTQKEPTKNIRDKAEAISSTFGLLDTIEKNFDPAWVGPVAGRLTSASTMTDIMNSQQKSVFASALSSLFNELLKLRSGAAVTESELARLQQEMPTLNMPPQTFMARMGLFRNLLELKRDAWMSGKVLDISSVTPEGHALPKDPQLPESLRPNQNQKILSLDELLEKYK